MARSLSNMFLKGIADTTGSLRPMVGLGFVAGQHMRYSVRIGGDSDTHDDFQPTDKVHDSGITMQDVVQQDVKENPVMIYMKGVPDAPRCGFSSLAVKVLQQYRVPISARDILANPEIKNGVKAFTNWPTFPQIFIKGEFIGGSDIVLKMHQEGELKDLLKDVATDANPGKA